jgi:hypothetical protein
VTINVTQATPVITWAKPTAIVYGTALGGTQLDATANVPGSFSYTPPAGTVLHVGNNQTPSVTFTPTDTTDYATVKATATINVTQATPVITWANPATIVYGKALGTTQLNAKANTSGTFSYTPPAGTVLPAGSGQTLSATFTPTDATDYTSASANVTINVTQATPVITWAKPTAIVYGTALGGTQLDAIANVPGSFSYTPPAGTVLPAGSGQTLSVTFTPTDATDYSSASASVTINVSPVGLTITANNATKVYGAPLPTFTTSYSGFVNGDTSASLTTQPKFSTTATAASKVGSYPITVSRATDPNYTITFVNGTLTVTAAPLVIAGNNSVQLLLTIGTMPDKNVQLSLNAASDLSCRIEVSADLVHWTALTNIYNVNGTNQAMDLNATNFQRRFYRTVWAPVVFEN